MTNSLEPLTVKATAEIGETKTTFEASGLPHNVVEAFRLWLDGVEKTPIKIDFPRQELDVKR